MGEPYQILVDPQTRCPVIYYKEGARAFWQLSQAPAAEIKTRVYNINGVLPPYSAQELVDTVTGLIPQAKLSFAPDPKINQMMQHIGRLQLDDSKARAEWGWRSTYDLPAMVRQFIADFQASRAHPTNEQGLSHA